MLLELSHDWLWYTYVIICDFVARAVWPLAGANHYRGRDGNRYIYQQPLEQENWSTQLPQQPPFTPRTRHWETAGGD